MKKYINVILKWSVCLLIVAAGCKQDFIQGVKTGENGKVYFPDADTSGILIPLLQKDNYYTLDTVKNTLKVSIPVYRGGFVPTTPFTVTVSVDNSVIDGLVASGELPANTMELASGDYTLAPEDTLSQGEGAMAMGVVVPEIKIESLKKYSGKTVALGLALKGASKFNINTEQNKVVVYFDVDSLLDAIIPPENLIVRSAWKVLNIANNDNVQISFNTDSSEITFTGGNNGHMAVYQAVRVKANKEYKIDMNVSGSGATDTWFEAYVNSAVPRQGQDYTTGKLISLNTWAGCGTSPFNGLLSKLNCSGDGNIISFPASGTVYVLVKSGGADLGTSGITISNVVFIRTD